METQGFVTYEMNALNGSVSLQTSGTFEQPQPGDTWTLSVTGGPKNQPVMISVNPWIWPPQFMTVGQTDGQGNYKWVHALTIADVTQGFNYPVWIPFPNSVGNIPTTYQDPNAPKGFRNVTVAILSLYPQG